MSLHAIPQLLDALSQRGGLLGVLAVVGDHRGQLLPVHDDLSRNRSVAIE